MIGSWLSETIGFQFSFSPLTRLPGGQPLLLLLCFFIIFQPSCSTSHYYEMPNNNPMSQLEEKYSVYLDSTWTTKQAHALLKVFESIFPNLNLQFSRWSITDDGLENDIKIESKDKIKFVTISKDVFPVEESQEVLSPGKHLYYAVVQYVTENGANRAIIELILQKRYGIYVPSYDSSTDASSTELTERNPKHRIQTLFGL